MSKSRRASPKRRRSTMDRSLDLTEHAPESPQCFSGKRSPESEFDRPLFSHSSPTESSVTAGATSPTPGPQSHRDGPPTASAPIRYTTALPLTPLPPRGQHTGGQGMKATLVNIDAVASLLMCSARTVWRLRDGGRIPAPLNVGRCVRWRLADLEAWLAAGCPDVRRTKWTAPTAACCGGCHRKEAHHE